MSATPTFYILHGDDSFSRGLALARMREALGEDGDLNRSEYDGTEISVAEALGAVKSLPFLAEKRLVIINGLIRHITRRGAGAAGKRAADRLIDALPDLPVYARLVLVESEALSEKNRVLKAARAMKNGYVSEFRPPQNLTRWIIERAKTEYAAAMTPGAAHAIASLVNNDLRRADNELCKLALYVDRAGTIQEEDVAALTPYVPEANVFEMVDALANGDGKRALELIKQSLHDDPRDQGFRLFALIARQFRLLTMTRDHLDQGGGSQAAVIAKAVGVQPFVAGRLARQARRFHIDELEAILKRLQRYDQDIKTGRIEARLALDLLATGLANT